MREFEFTPLARPAVACDRLASGPQTALRTEPGSYSPCNIERYGEGDDRLVMAVAGFPTASSEELTVR